MPEITIKLGDQTLQTCRFDGDLLRIGRSRENDIVLENLSVSRDHAQIRLHNGKYLLTDLNSANGTLVNGVRITKTEVVHEDVVTIGKHKLHFQNPPPAAMVGDGLADVVRTVLVEPRAEAWVVVESGRLEGREFKITRFETSLGKAASNDIVLTDDWLLAKKQAIILRKGNNAFEIQDLGGLRKVKVNGKAVNDSADIVDGDIIELGGTRICFRCSSAQNTPTGRVPKEIAGEAAGAGEPIREAGSLNGARKAPTDVNHPVIAGNSPLLTGDESLDLEDGFQSIRMSLTDESGIRPAASEQVQTNSEEEDRQPALVQDCPVAVDEQQDDLAEESVPTPIVPLSSAVIATAAAGSSVSTSQPRQPAMPSGMAGAMAGASREPHYQAFEDKRSTSRRRRKHHQRAVQKQAAQQRGGEDISSTSAPVAVKPQPSMQQSELTSEKEIVMWEAALSNPSPAIKRQAVKMLKKLTGRDYEV